jgi:hypothetical protein
VRRVETPERAFLEIAADAWDTLMGGFTTVQSVGAEADAPARETIEPPAVIGQEGAIAPGLRSGMAPHGEGKEDRYARSVRQLAVFVGHAGFHDEGGAARGVDVAQRVAGESHDIRLQARRESADLIA